MSGASRLELLLGGLGRRIFLEGTRVRVERLFASSSFVRCNSPMRSSSDTRCERVFLLGVELDLVNSDERVPFLELLVDRLEDRRDRQLLLVVRAQVNLERLARLRCADVDVEDVAVRVDRARDVVQVLLLELAEPILQLDVLGFVVRRDRRS